MVALLYAAALLVVMALCVLGTLVIENWRRLRVELHSPVPSVVAGAPAPIDRGADVVLVLDGRSAADRLAGVLFAAYAARRLEEANRVAAWVTAVEWPPTGFGGAFRPGANLRGRPAAVARLLECSDEGRCWVTLSPTVDVERGLHNRPPRCEVLKGVAAVWWATRTDSAEIDAGSIEDVRAAVLTLGPIWGPTTGGADVEPLLDALSAAAEAGASLHLVVADPTGTAIGPTSGAGPDLPADSGRMLRSA